MNKETLEEVAIINYKKLYEGEPLTQDVPIDAFKQGAKWQQERMYSEEEVRKIAEEVRWQAIGDPLEFTKNFNEWFEQFKKK